MDTIQIKLSIPNGENLTQNNIRDLKEFINNIKSPKMHTYCDFIDVRSNGDIGIKVSYPRFYYGSNVFLIKTNKEALQVNEHLCLSLSYDPLLKDSDITLERVDIPFTYVIKKPAHGFFSYSNIYCILGEVYKKQRDGSIQKAFVDLLTNEKETVIYCDSKTISAYNSKVIIYDQGKNIKNKATGIDFEDHILSYPDLENRIRIEASKRVKRKSFSNKEFSKFDILNEYLSKFKKYIFTNLLNFEVIDFIYKEKTESLVEYLKKEKAFGNFNYTIFYLKISNFLYDYEILRRAFNLFHENKKTRESAITKMRKILNEDSERNHIIIMDTYSELKNIKETIDSFYDIAPIE